MNFKKAAFLFILFLIPSLQGMAAWVWSPEKGEFVKTAGSDQSIVEDQYDYAMKLYREKNVGEAAKQFEEIVKKHPSAPLAAEAQYRVGTIYEEKTEYMKAFEAYKFLVEAYPQSERFSEVIERQFRIGNLFLSGQKGKLMGLEIVPSLPKAAEVFETIVKNAPYGNFGDQAQFHLGLVYKKWGRFDEAVDAFQGLIDRYPQSDWVPEARFQLAETSFERSKMQFRDQRALDDASTQVTRFLERYPDSGTSEKAAKIRQVIDEKNAEKNYQIGLYYEKDNYLQSALIYYSDVAKNYPHTQWGQKAVERVKVLKDPTAYHARKEKELQDEIQSVQAQMESLPKESREERAKLERRLEHLKEQGKEMRREEKESLESRRQDIKRREQELKDKFKKLGKKKKLMEKNPSEDLKRAIERWEASLVEEQDALLEEKRQMKEWQGELGLESGKSPLEFVPFLGESPDELDQVRQIEAKKLYKLASEKKKLLEEKERLYRQYSEVSASFGTTPLPVAQLPEGDLQVDAMMTAAGDQLKPQQEKIRQTQGEIQDLQKEMEEKRAVYEKNYGSPSWLYTLNVSTPSVLGASVAVNPFAITAEGLKGKSMQELLELRMHLREQISAQQNMTETLSQAFNAELTLQAQKRILASLESGEKVDPEELRKTIKRLERGIRSRYEEIQDRHDRKRELLEELDRLLKSKESEAGAFEKTGRVLAAPAVFLYRFQKAFLFGMEDKDERLTQTAKGMKEGLSAADEVRTIEEEIELESLLIEAKDREIQQLGKELEIMKAKASLEGGFKFRSSLVEIPYKFIGEAIESARRIVPTEERDEILIERLDEETQMLELLRDKLNQVEKRIGEAERDSKGGAAGVFKGEEGVKSETALKEEIQSLAGQLKIQRGIYQREIALFRNQLKDLKIEVKEEGKLRVPEGAARALDKKQEKWVRDRKELAKDLLKTIEGEDGLEGEEAAVLEKRMKAIDQAVEDVHSKALREDLLSERQKMEERLSQIKDRRTFLSNEMERFQPTEGGGAK